MSYSNFSEDPHNRVQKVYPAGSGTAPRKSVEKQKLSNLGRYLQV